MAGLAVLGVFAAVSLFGLWLHLPLILHALLLALSSRGFRLAVVAGARDVVPGRRRERRLARLEDDSGVEHQPLQALDDTLPEGFVDPATRRLWALHRQRLIASLERVRLAPPRSDLPRRDPWALRAALLLVLVLGLVHARGDIGPRLASGFSFGGRSAASRSPPAVDLWVTPPAYTRRPPLVSEQTRGVESLAVPAGSEGGSRPTTCPRRDRPPSWCSARAGPR